MRKSASPEAGDGILCCVLMKGEGVDFRQMRICHMFHGKDEIRFGIYACSSEDSAFKASFTNMELMDCRWKAHDGQQPDEE